VSALILIVEDEPDLSSTLEFNLEKEGFKTRVAATGEEAIRLAAEPPAPDLILLDLMLPDISGTEVCRRLRQDPATRPIPVMMLTARSEEIDRIVGFELGADDYVTKPYSVRELLLRIRAVLRRSATSPSEAAPESAEIQFGCLRIDLEAHRVWVEDEEIPLTALEFKLLHTLMSRQGRVQTRKQLLQDVWAIHADVNTRTVDTHVKRLRQKILAAGDYIETLRGVGYRFRTAPPDEARV
jgi:two-component system phosphate regulon response regulator PhoB